ncbi:carboxymuconolactone decarboxylase family protein [Rhizomonospora bruguierae]|uniref:carboxymuconolactone decarboxylase family protein n=1 Tax=Rhizomonospora bruguierae TaxID=1581705 RepID=UPI001BCE7621|nr:carboxymuconolactone decarboxylase family protein [Micromonospora sp. NBRC 107566]
MTISDDTRLVDGLAVRREVLGTEIQETLLQVAPYCGAPAALECFRVAERVLAELDAAS